MLPPDLVVLDLGLPDGDGLELTRQLLTWTSVPIIVLSARGHEADKVTALDAGADDYLTKPFGVGELTARIRVGRSLEIDLAARVVHCTDGSVASELRLTPTEFKLLAMLVKHAGRVLTRQQILREFWGPSHVGDVQYLRVYAGQLRQKLEREPAQPRFLITEPGVGYRLAESSGGA